MIRQRAPQGIPMRVLLKGDAGVGKSSLAQWFVNQIAPDPFAVKFFNGTEVTMERVSELIADLSYRPMGGGYRYVWIDEADGIPTTAHKRFLTLSPYFQIHTGKTDVPSSISIPTTEGEVLVTFTSRYKKLEDESPLVPLLGEKFVGQHFRQAFAISINGEKLATSDPGAPERNPAQEFLDEIQWMESAGACADRRDVQSPRTKAQHPTGVCQGPRSSPRESLV